MPFTYSTLKLAFVLFVAFLLPLFASAQQIRNPSFERLSTYGALPPFWENCGGTLSTPDVQPGAWGVSLPPADGSNYLGMVFRVRDHGSFESVTQTMNYPFHKDSCYTLDISLAFDPDYEDPNSRQPGILKVWGGNGVCSTVENLWNSPKVDHRDWKTYTLRISPSGTHSSITLQAYFASQPTYNGAILIDNIRNIKAYPKEKFSLGNDRFVCGNEEAVLDASAAGGPYLWQDGSSNSTFQVKKTGKYWVQAYMNGCKTSDTVQVIVQEPFQVDLGPDKQLCVGETFSISLNYPKARYTWSDNSSRANITIREPGTYWVEVFQGHCVVSDTILVTQSGCRFMIPDIITPNGDKLNDCFEIIDDNHGDWHLQIFNRYGAKIFSKENYRNDWDGKGLSEGVYYYVVKNKATGELYKGPVTILR